MGKGIVLIFVFFLLSGCVQGKGFGSLQETGFGQLGGKVFGSLQEMVFGNAQGKVFERVERNVVERAVDGDTLLLENGERVRLIGIDSREKGEKCFLEAKKRLQELTFGKKVVLARDVSNRDKYGRLVRFVFVQGKLVNLAMVEEGLAFAFNYEPDSSLNAVFQKAELEASKGNGCIWN